MSAKELCLSPSILPIAGEYVLNLPIFVEVSSISLKVSFKEYLAPFGSISTGFTKTDLPPSTSSPSG